MKISRVFAVLLLVMLIVPNLANSVECPPPSGVTGKDVAESAPDFLTPR